MHSSPENSIIRNLETTNNYYRIIQTYHIQLLTCMFGSKWVIVDGLDTNTNKIEVDITLLKQTGIVLSLFRVYCGLTALNSD